MARDTKKSDTSSSNKSNDYGKGRADTANGKYDPPSRGPMGGVFDTSKQWERDTQRRNDYHEGRGDKLREMGKK